MCKMCTFKKKKKKEPGAWASITCFSEHILCCTTAQKHDPPSCISQEWKSGLCLTRRAVYIPIVKVDTLLTDSCLQAFLGSPNLIPHELLVVPLKEVTFCTSLLVVWGKSKQVPVFNLCPQ